MAIVINGSGTVTGISVGGLPDDIVDSGTLANDAVGLAQMAGGTDGNIITYDASGNPAVVATGSSGQILTSAGAGAAPTMAAGMTPAFQAHNSASQTGLSDGTYNKVAFNTQDFSTGGTYDTTNHRWTPGVIGKYYIAFHAHTLAAAASTLKQLYVRIYKNGASIDESDGGRDDQDNRGMGGNFMSSVIVTMDADDYVEAYIFMNTHAQDFNITGGTLNGGAFYGYRLIGA